jgi:hypothetical protein
MIALEHRQNNVTAMAGRIERNDTMMIAMQTARTSFYRSTSSS